MIKIAMIGAGSVVFSKNLTGDILSYPEFKDAHLAYMDVDAERLHVGAALCRKVAKALNANPSIEATTDRRTALAGADFVINMVQVGGFNSTLVDFEIPRKYGLNFTIADTTGPGGLFRALRTFPMLTALCQDIADLCPRAVLLNYSNPMSMNMQTIARGSGTSVRAIGLCHSVQGTFEQLMRYLGEDPATVAFTCAGINHMAFYLSLQKAGADLYPRLFEAMAKPEVYNTNKIRFELMRRLGYFVTESSEHSAEYSPWFIPHGRHFSARYNVPIDEYLRRCDGIVSEFDRLKQCAASDEPITVRRSHEYGSTIIHSMVTGTPSIVYGNQPNCGSIENLPDDAIVEVPVTVERDALRPAVVGGLPPQLIAYVQPHVSQHELFIRSAMEGRRDHLYHAAMFDPLTAATLTLDQTVEMVDELIAAHAELLPPLDAKKTLIPTSGKTFPRVDPQHLRASWCAAQAEAAKDFILNWHVIGPFRSATPGNISLDLPTPLDDARSVDLSSPIGPLRWKSVTGCAKTGFVNLARDLASAEFCVAYAYAEIESIHPRDTILRCGSDDGIRVYLNGEQVHSHDVGRAYKPNANEAPIHLKTGTNRLLVKVSNYQGAWGFGLLIPRATS